MWSSLFAGWTLVVLDVMQYTAVGIANLTARSTEAGERNLRCAHESWRSKQVFGSALLFEKELGNCHSLEYRLGSRKPCA